MPRNARRPHSGVTATNASTTVITPEIMRESMTDIAANQFRDMTGTGEPVGVNPLLIEDMLSDLRDSGQALRPVRTHVARVVVLGIPHRAVG
jgi:hypothetical protein